MSAELPSAQSSCCRFLKCLQPCSDLFGNFRLGNPVYPLEPSAPNHSDFLIVGRHRKLRIVHVKPISTASHTNHIEKRRSSNRTSLSEEYWFTRWNKPLKLGNCNCSFRRSQRLSALSNQRLSLSLLPSESPVVDGRIPSSNGFIIHYNVPSIKITNVETFVERLVQETVFEAFQEHYMKCAADIESQGAKKPLENGAVNLGFVREEDTVDSVVLRRKPQKDLSRVLSSSIKNGEARSENIVKRNCLHSKSYTSNKPLVILLHGIGSSADVWWTVINSLTYKGYEVIAPDMLGHGYSSVPNLSSAYKFNNLLKHTLAVFDHYLGSDESRKSIIIGHSYGCSLATALSRYRAQQIIQLILISGGGPTPLAPPARENEISSSGCLQFFIKPLLFCGMKRTLFYSSRGKHFDECEPSNAVPPHVLQYIQEGQDWPEGDAAFHRRILIPTLLVHGLQDTQVTLVQECEMERTIPRAFLELIPNAGHMSMTETPEHLSHMIMCFIDWWSR